MELGIFRSRAPGGYGFQIVDIILRPQLFQSLKYAEVLHQHKLTTIFFHLFGIVADALKCSGLLEYLDDHSLVSGRFHSSQDLAQFFFQSLLDVDVSGKQFIEFRYYPWVQLSLFAQDVGMSCQLVDVVAGPSHLRTDRIERAEQFLYVDRYGTAPM